MEGVIMLENNGCVDTVGMICRGFEQFFFFVKYT